MFYMKQTCPKPSCLRWQQRLKHCAWAVAGLAPASVVTFERFKASRLRQTANANFCNTCPSFIYTCRLLFIIPTQKLIVSLNICPYELFWTVFICSLSISRNSQLESDVCLTREAQTLLQISSPVIRDRACSVILWSEKSIFVAFNQRAEISRKKKS